MASFTTNYSNWIDANAAIESPSVGQDLQQAMGEVVALYDDFYWSFYYGEFGIDSATDTEIHGGTYYGDSFSLLGNFSSSSSWTINTLLFDSNYPDATVGFVGSMKVSLSSGKTSGSISQINHQSDFTTVSAKGNFGQLTADSYSLTEISYTFDNGVDSVNAIYQGKFNFNIYSGIVTGTIQSVHYEDDGQYFDAGGLSLNATSYFNGDSNLSALLSGNDTVTGVGDNQDLNSGGGNDTLISGGLHTIMEGGVGNDTYIVNDITDVVSELGGTGNGIDLVQSSVTFTLGDSVENLTLTGTDNINGVGNAAANVINGNSGNNLLQGNGANDTLNGSAGNDTLDGGIDADSMSGGAGDDVYLVDNLQDKTIESSNAGSDTVQSTISWTLSSNLEKLVLLGSDNINGTGNTVGNQITGNTGNNILDGGTGADTMVGGLGDDTYTVDNTADGVIEQVGEGSDTIRSSASFNLGTNAVNVENLTLSGSSSINATGDGGANVLTGNDGSNVLDGGGAADVLIGAKGNDTYVIDNAGDSITEVAGQGTDLVRSSFSYTLGTDLENLELSAGAGSINGTGNSVANNIKGNEGNNILNGGGGVDTLAGSAGDDTYIVNLIQSGSGSKATAKLEDSITENTNAGTADTVVLQGAVALTAATTLTLGSNLEGLDASATGTTLLNLTGNTANNFLIGNDANNIIDGLTGNDALTGGLGSDHFVFSTTLNAATNVDSIEDFVAGTDFMDLDNDIFKALGAAGSLNDQFFSIGAVALDANDHLIYNDSTGQLFYDADGSGSSAQILFAQLDTGLALTHADFTVLN